MMRERARFALGRTLLLLALAWTGSPGRVDAAARPAAQEPGAPARIDVAFKLDPRLSGPTYGGERWVAPTTFTGATAQESVEVRAHATDAKGRTSRVALRWVAADPDMLSITPVREGQVKLLVKRAGESKVTIRAPNVSAELLVKARRLGDVLQLEIVQLASGTRGPVDAAGEQPAALTSGTPAATPHPGRGSARANRASGAAFLAAHREKEGVVVLPSGLQYRVLAQGRGEIPSDHDTVTFHYRGELVDGTVFVDSRRRGRPAKLDVARAIPGMKEALKLMPVGSRWQLVVPPELAYGARGLRGRRSSARAVGPSETLVYEVELLAAERPAQPTGKTFAAMGSTAPRAR